VEYIISNRCWFEIWSAARETWVTRTSFL